MPKISRKPRQLPHAPNNKPLNFKQSDVERCIRAARAQNVPIRMIEIDPKSGKISITPGTLPADDSVNEWDEGHGKAKAAAR